MNLIHAFSFLIKSAAILNANVVLPEASLPLISIKMPSGIELYVIKSKAGDPKEKVLLNFSVGTPNLATGVFAVSIPVFSYFLLIDKNVYGV